jgi:hypothetical protein
LEAAVKGIMWKFPNYFSKIAPPNYTTQLIRESEFFGPYPQPLTKWINKFFS